MTQSDPPETRGAQNQYQNQNRQKLLVCLAHFQSSHSLCTKTIQVTNVTQSAEHNVFLLQWDQIWISI